MSAVKLLALASALLAAQLASGAECGGTPLAGAGGVPKAWKLDGGGIAAFAKMNINIDGYAKAYHPNNAGGGALIHLCNAGRVVLPDGTRYHGSENNATCTGKFMTDVARIEQAGWMDRSVGAVEWYGILGEGTAVVAGRKVSSVKPVEQRDGSGFYVSPTSLADATVSDRAEQSRYVNPLRIAAAVAPKSIAVHGAAIGSFGVAYSIRKRIAVPFVIGDAGPRIGEGSVALARSVAGLPISDDITRANRFAGQVDRADVLWVFFGDGVQRFDSRDPGATFAAAALAFATWGGQARLDRCVSTVPRN
ncbi:hypothetical protein [Hydrogenophaga flava]|uniref:hypothetical protein n=1 Tax=Hydrogenophaga flava TaxID=65657 RepID=UPI0008260C5A|nr:hypothetical protein [Hydrogenophaga flava]